MKQLAFALGLLLPGFLLSTGCSDEPGPKIDGLQFPVVVLFGNAATRLCNEPSELTNMHSNYIVLNSETPALIDSAFKIYAMERLRSVHTSLWLMANPSGATDVTFELEPTSSGREAAREFFARQLEKQTRLHDLAARRSRLATEQTLLGMLMLVQGEREEL